MPRDEIDPMVPTMPTAEPTGDIRADGGRRRRYDGNEVEAALVPDLR